MHNTILLSLLWLNYSRGRWNIQKHISFSLAKLPQEKYLSNISGLCSHKFLFQRHFLRTKPFKENKHLEIIYFQWSHLSYNNIWTWTSCLESKMKMRIRKSDMNLANFRGWKHIKTWERPMEMKEESPNRITSREMSLWKSKKRTKDKALLEDLVSAL